jgi:uncharacterized protein YtpQ (UPF0354 family)
MGKVLKETDFSRIVVTRAQRERPDIRVMAMGNFLLLVEPEPGRQRMVSMASLYRAYMEYPMDRDEVIGNFLSSLVYDEPAVVRGTFAQHRHKVLPQVVPPTLLSFCRRDDRELAAVEFIDGLAVAFVLDEPDRYAYLHKRVADQWGVTETDLLTAAIQNLHGMELEDPPFYQLGTGIHLTLAWETFDGYDASRVLLTRELNEMAAVVAGNPVIGLPHRDYMVMFGDADPDYVTVMADRIREMFEEHSYPITSQLYTLQDGRLVPYDPEVARRKRMVN